MNEPMELNDVPMRGKSLLNRARVKKYMLDRAQKTGRTNKVRVSKRTLEDVEAHLRILLDNRVHRAPSKGKTL